MTIGLVPRSRGLEASIVPPAVSREASHFFSAPAVLGLGDRPYTPAMRRFVCVAALLFGFSGDRYAWTARPRMPVPVVQPVRLRESGGTVRDPAWWRA